MIETNVPHAYVFFFSKFKISFYPHRKNLNGQQTLLKLMLVGKAKIIRNVSETHFTALLSPFYVVILPGNKPY